MPVSAEVKESLLLMASEIEKAQEEMRRRVKELQKLLKPSPYLQLMQEERIPWDAVSYLWNVLADLSSKDGFDEREDVVAELRELAGLDDEKLREEFSEEQARIFVKEFGEQPGLGRQACRE